MILATMPGQHRRDRAFETSPNRRNGEVSNTLGQPQRPPIRAVPKAGTALAINYFRLGVAGHLPRDAGRGGARNRADRTSHALSAVQVGNLIAAAGHAGTIGLPLNRMLTIHWEAAGMPLKGMAKATGRFTDLLGKFLARHKGESAVIWTHESGDRKGGHCHLLAHVPAALVSRLTGLVRGWLRAITGQPYRRGVILSRPIGGRLGVEAGNPDLHCANLAAALAYVVKGAGAAGGLVIGKRCGTSQNIASAARKRKD